MSGIIGVKYIGSKPSREDSVTNSGAVWKPEEVLNFHVEPAKRLLAFKDVWVQAPKTKDKTVYGSTKPVVSQKHTDTAHPNINYMTVGQVVEYAKINLRLELDPAAMTEDEIRNAVRREMVMQNLDDHEDEIKEHGPSVVANVLKPEGDPVPPVEENKAPDELPTLSQLLTSLNMQQLEEFAAQENVAIPDGVNEDELRTLLMETLSGEGNGKPD